MRITVFGATGAVGREVVAEARATRLADVERLTADQDLVISATRPVCECRTRRTGESRISTADLAVALLDEAERPKHHRTRFTVGY